MPRRLRRLVTTLAVTGLLLQVLAALLFEHVGPIVSVEDRLSWAHGPLLLALLLGLTVAGDLVSVRVRHGEES